MQNAAAPVAQATAEPGMTAARGRLILADENRPPERGMRDRQQVEILRYVRFVAAHRPFVGKAQVLGMEQVHPDHRRRHVAHANPPRPDGPPRVQRERGRDLQHAGPARRPADSTLAGTPKREARPDDRQPATRGGRPRRVTLSRPVRLPAHQQPEQAVLRRTRQKLIDQRLPVAQREEHACRKELRPQATPRGDFDEAEAAHVANRDARPVIQGSRATWYTLHGVSRNAHVVPRPGCAHPW